MFITLKFIAGFSNMCSMFMKDVEFCNHILYEMQLDDAKEHDPIKSTLRRP